MIDGLVSTIFNSTVMGLANISSLLYIFRPHDKQYIYMYKLHNLFYIFIIYMFHIFVYTHAFVQKHQFIRYKGTQVSAVSYKKFFRQIGVLSQCQCYSSFSSLNTSQIIKLFLEQDQMRNYLHFACVNQTLLSSLKKFDQPLHMPR